MNIGHEIIYCMSASEETGDYDTLIMTQMIAELPYSLCLGWLRLLVDIVGNQRL